jgi:hypothetical protein
LPALEAAGMTDEAALARDALTRQLHQDILAVWFTQKGDRLDSVTEDLAGIGSTKDIPAEFNYFIGSRIARQEPLLEYRIFLAYLDRNWDAASALGTTFTRLYPTFYTSYWFLGRSLAELGKKREAIAPLTIYCQYSHDEIWYPDAKNLLEKLTGAPK